MPNNSIWSLSRLLGLTGAEEQSKRQRVLTIIGCGIFGVVVVLVLNWLT